VAVSALGRLLARLRLAPPETTPRVIKWNERPDRPPSVLVGGNANRPELRVWADEAGRVPTIDMDGDVIVIDGHIAWEPEQPRA
jgi:hypothetical protein